jgi:uncharacterized membrane protein YraQ (UPF0718 family)
MTSHISTNDDRTRTNHHSAASGFASRATSGTGRRFWYYTSLLLIIGFIAWPFLTHHHAMWPTYSLLFTGIVLEALPFMLLGAAVSGIIEVYVKKEWLLSRLPQKTWVVTCIAGGLGMIFPVCECAIVPVVRRLTRKGIPFPAAIAYLLGGPIVNPIVGFSTYWAYGNDIRIVAIRLLSGYLVAVAVGLMMGRLFKNRTALIDSVHGDEKHSCACGHDHNHDHASPDGVTKTRRFLGAIRHASDDFIAVIHFLIIGAALAAGSQTFLNRNLVLALSDYPMLPEFAMMALAILLNICSEADAFIAASFRGLVPLSAQLAFMLIGPMFDIKLLLMYRTVFTRKAILALSLMIIGMVSFVIGLFNLIGVMIR